MRKLNLFIVLFVQLLLVACSQEGVPDDTLCTQEYEQSHSEELDKLLIDP